MMNHFEYLPPDVLRLLLQEYLPRWMRHPWRIVCKRFLATIPHPRMIIGNLPMTQEFCRAGQLDLVRWAHARDPSVIFQEGVTKSAAAGGNVALLEWLLSHGVVFKTSDAGRAAEKGHVAALDWLLQISEPTRSDIESHVIWRTMRGGQVEILQLLISKYGIRWKGYMTERLAEEGHFSAVVWLHQNRHPLGNLIPRVAFGGNVRLAQWLLEESGLEIPASSHTEMLWSAIHGTKVPMIEYLISKLGIQPGKRQMTQAILKHDVGVIRCLRRHGCPWNTNTCHEALENHGVDWLKTLRAEGCPWDADNTRVAQTLREMDDPQVLEWARAEGCPGL